MAALNEKNAKIMKDIEMTKSQLQTTSENNFSHSYSATPFAEKS
jgi:hypothetical protein